MRRRGSKRTGDRKREREREKKGRKTVRIVNEASHPNIMESADFELQISSPVDRERTAIPGQSRRGKIPRTATRDYRRGTIYQIVLRYSRGENITLPGDFAAIECRIERNLSERAYPLDEREKLLCHSIIRCYAFTLYI